MDDQRDQQDLEFQKREYFPQIILFLQLEEHFRKPVTEIFKISYLKKANSHQQ